MRAMLRLKHEKSTSIPNEKQSLEVIKNVIATQALLNKLLQVISGAVWEAAGAEAEAWWLEQL